MAHATLMAKTNNLTKKCHFSQEDIQMAIKHMKRCLASLVIKCKSKLKCAITSYWSEWPSSKCLQMINAGRVWRKEKPPTPLVK